MQSKLIALAVFLVFVLSFIYFTVTTKQYKILSLIEYEAFNQNVFDPSQAVQFASSGN